MGLKAPYILAQNIKSLLGARHQTAKSLAQWCRHSEPWIGKFLAGKREVQLRDLDRIADFFGLATYQLFQPGISPLTERRKGPRSARWPGSAGEQCVPRNETR